MNQFPWAWQGLPTRIKEEAWRGLFGRWCGAAWYGKARPGPVWRGRFRCGSYGPARCGEVKRGAGEAARLLPYMPLTSITGGQRDEATRRRWRKSTPPICATGATSRSARTASLGSRLEAGSGVGLQGRRSAGHRNKGHRRDRTYRIRTERSGSDSVSEVWKFQLEIEDTQTLWMPADADLLFVAVQHDHLCLSGACDPDEARRGRGDHHPWHLGHPIGQQPYIGSVLMADGMLVWHVFDGGET